MKAIILKKYGSIENFEKADLPVPAIQKSANENAIGLYKQFGFAEYGRLETFLSPVKNILPNLFFI